MFDGCSLALCSTTVSVVSAGICNRDKVNSTAWLYRKGSAKAYFLLLRALATCSILFAAAVLICACRLLPRLLLQCALLLPNCEGSHSVRIYSILVMRRFQKSHKHTNLAYLYALQLQLRSIFHSDDLCTSLYTETILLKFIHNSINARIFNKPLFEYSTHSHPHTNVE